MTVRSQIAGSGRSPVGVVDFGFPNGDLDSRLVEGLERLSLALDVLLRRTAREHHLSPLQVQLLARLRHDGGARRRLRDLTRSCGVPTAAIRSAIADLESKGLVERPAERDARTVRLVLTPAGRSRATAASAWAGPVRRAIARTAVRPKESLLPLLVDWVASLHRARVLAAARVCPTCRFFAPDVHPDSGAPHHCQLFETAFAGSALQVDCPEHRPF